ncbi:MAG: hypothetical protein WCC10_12630 [Tumebacillaceae bacterium]
MALVCEICGAAEGDVEEIPLDGTSKMSRDILHVCENCRADRQEPVSFS